MSMIDIFKDTLQKGMVITNCKELSNRYKITLMYEGMEGTCELNKMCAPNSERALCRKSIDTAISGMYINIGNLLEAKAWLEGERWDTKTIKSRTITLTEEEIECFNAYIESEKVDVAFGNTDWCSIYNKIVGDKVSDYAKNKMDLYQP